LPERKKKEVTPHQAPVVARGLKKRDQGARRKGSGQMKEKFKSTVLHKKSGINMGSALALATSKRQTLK